MIGEQETMRAEDWLTQFPRKIMGYPYVRRLAKKVISPAFTLDHDFCCRSFGKMPLESNAKVLVVGLPKSGTMWLTYLMMDIFKMSQVSGRLRERGVCHMHAPLGMVQFRHDIKQAVYIMRDIRDVVVSYFFFSQTEAHRKFSPACCFDDCEKFYYEYFLSKMIPRYGWELHPWPYAAAGVPIIKYERLWDDPLRELIGLQKRWGLEFDEKTLSDAVEKNAIDRLKSAKKEEKHSVPTTHFRRGGYGNYKEVLPQNVIDDIEKRFGDYLLRWGYEV